MFVNHHLGWVRGSVSKYLVIATDHIVLEGLNVKGAQDHRAAM
jgi:hypothetical protein